MARKRRRGRLKLRPSDDGVERRGAAPVVVAIGLASYLLFTIELMAGRLVLPVFGGSPGVWTTALVLFTGLLFVGYLYAHVVVTRLGRDRAGTLHLIVTAILVAVAILAPVDLASLRVPEIPEALNVLGALMLIAGAPVFLLATTTPLVSAWWARGGHEPWWLYALSNGASFVALLTYPLIVERLMPLSVQRTAVALGLIAYALAIAYIVVEARRPEPVPEKRPKRTRRQATDQASAPAPLGRWRQLRWLAVAFVPAGLLAAITNFIATDLISAPLVWVGPLSIYLASFVVAFSEQGRRSLRWVEWLVPAAITLSWFPFVFTGGLAAAPLLVMILGSYAVIAVALHGRLALDRPEEAHLTRFYLVIAAAGLLATGFVALLAPLVFSTIYEYPLLVVAAAGALWLIRGPEGPWSAAVGRKQVPMTARSAGIALVPYLAALGLLWLLVEGAALSDSVIALITAGAIVVVVGRTPALLGTATAVCLVVFSVVMADPVVERVRTFFGVTEVQEREGPAWAEYSGTTLHGVQFLDDRSAQPTTYYVSAGPLGDAFKDLRARSGSGDVGVVGLGTGTIAAYAQPGDSMTFFEIDPAIVDLASSGRFFTYLTDSPVTPRIVLGDARLSLEDEPDASFDLLVMDAFSSDAVPAHLLTREAIEMYQRKLKPGGVTMFHVSNRYYELAGAVMSTARAAGLTAADLTYQPGPTRVHDLSASTSQYVVVGEEEDVARFLPLGWTSVRRGPVLTDDFFDVLRLLS